MIARRIIALRRKHGWSQAQLAKKLYITASAEGNYEQGRRLPNVETLILMAQLFDVSLDYLITGREHTQKASTADASLADCPCSSCFWKSLN